MGVKPIKGLLLIAMLASSVAEGQQNLLPEQKALAAPSLQQTSLFLTLAQRTRQLL